MNWTTVMTGAELERHFAKMAKLDPMHAAAQRVFYQTRTETQLRVLASQAWNANERESYVLANSFLAREIRTQTA